MPFCSKSAADWALAGIPQSSVATSAVARCLMVMTVGYKANVTELLPRCPFWVRDLGVESLLACGVRPAGTEVVHSKGMKRPGILAGAALSLALLVSCTRVKPGASLPAPPRAAADADHEDNPFEAAEYFREQRVLGEGLLPMERDTTA